MITIWFYPKHNNLKNCQVEKNILNNVKLKYYFIVQYSQKFQFSKFFAIQNSIKK